MKISKHSPVHVAKELLESRYAGAEVVFLAGSVVRGEASSYSDLDLVVIYPKVEKAYRESFYYKEWPVEAFIHDPETINYFFLNVDRPSGVAALPEMVWEGLEVPGPTPTSQKLKSLADAVIKQGPLRLSGEEILKRCYIISGLIDDIREPRSRHELQASSVLAYQEVADFYFRSRESWSGRGKSMLRRMKRADVVFYRRFVESFDELFASGNTKKVIELVEELLVPYGGLIFEGYRVESPTDWRKSL